MMLLALNKLIIIFLSSPFTCLFFTHPYQISHFLSSQNILKPFKKLYALNSYFPFYTLEFNLLAPVLSTSSWTSPMPFHLLYTPKNLTPLFIFLCIPPTVLPIHSLHWSKTLISFPVLILHNAQILSCSSLLLLLWRWQQQAPPKWWYLLTNLVLHPTRKKYLLITSEQYIYFKVIPTHNSKQMQKYEL